MSPPNDPTAGDYTEVEQDKAGKWRWHRKAPNHAVIATSGESFDSHRNAQQAADRVFPDRGEYVAGGPAWWLLAAAIALLVIGGIIGWFLHRPIHQVVIPGPSPTITVEHTDQPTAQPTIHPTATPLNRPTLPVTGK